MRTFLNFLREEDGPTAVEYAVMLALILLFVLGSVQYLTTETAASYNNTGDRIHEAFTNAGVGN